MRRALLMLAALAAGCGPPRPPMPAEALPQREPLVEHTYFEVEDYNVVVFQVPRFGDRCYIVLPHRASVPSTIACVAGAPR